MTISQFSDRTGLRPKLLRYYEEAGLIIPAVRLENGYRQYEEAQVETAQLVNSLRQADVSMAGIREFLLAPPERRESLLKEWRGMAAAKLLSIQVANQFLQGLDPRTKRMHLVHWDCPKRLAWFPVESRSPDLNLEATVRTLYEQRANPRKAYERSGYVRFITDNQETIAKMEVGFLLLDTDCIPAGAEVELIPPTLFATMDSRWDMPFSCKPILATITRFGFQPVGEPIRKVTFTGNDSYTLMVPVMTQ